MFLNWAAYLYAGTRARNHRWMQYGYVLLGSQLILGLNIYLVYVRDMEFAETAMIGAWIFWFVLGMAAIIYAFVYARPRYLRIIRGEEEPPDGARRRHETARWSGGVIRYQGPPGEPGGFVPAPPAGSASRPGPEGVVLDEPTGELNWEIHMPEWHDSSHAAVARVDVNNCAMEELEALPGVTTLVAKRIDEIRRERHGFKTLDECCNTFRQVGLGFHQIDRLRPFLTVVPMVRKKKRRFTGRVVDY